MNYGLDLLTRDDYDDWRRGIPADVCPFCDWRRFQIVLLHGAHWLWIACRSPYWKWHTLFIPKRHFEEIGQISTVEMGELIDLYSAALKRLQMLKASLADGFGTDVLLFWRQRTATVDSSGNRPRHFHLHLAPHRDGLLDPALSSDATDWNPNDLVD